MAKPAHDDAPNRRKDLVTKFNHEYADALAEARVAADHTTTQGWRQLYAQRGHEVTEQRRTIARNLRGLADVIEDQGLGDAETKLLSEARKDLLAMNEAARQFDKRTVKPAIQPVFTCVKLVEQYRMRARRDEAAAPLHEAGLEELMREAIALQPVPKFDPDTGVVTIDG